MMGIAISGGLRRARTAGPGVIRVGLMAVAAAGASVAGWIPEPVQAQQSRPNVFFDCAGARCNRQYYRTEIDWVNWVNDKEVADVHLIMTSQGTGAGGREYVLDFMGTDEETPYRDQHSYQSLPTDTDREVLDGIANTLALGMAMFANQTGYRGLVTLAAVDQPEQVDGLVSADEVDDPWNLWVFRLNGQAGVEGESTYQNTELEGGFSAWRTTPTWKFSVSSGVAHNRLRFDLARGTFKDNRTRWNVDTRLIYALADHWSVGLMGSGGRFLTYNLNLRLAVTPTLEFSVFPYEETTRRSFTFRYSMARIYNEYTERTVYDQTAETRWVESMEVRLDQRQPWGSASLGTSGTLYLHNTDLFRFSIWGGASIRIVRGFSVNVSGNTSWVNDQIFLSAEGATDEEALLRLQRRPTDFDYGMEVGFNFQFGSIYNNVVNNRIRRRF